MVKSVIPSRFHASSSSLAYLNLISLDCAVTGTSSGLGSALLHEALSAGHSVVATTRKPAPLQAELDSKYDSDTLKRVLVVKLDVTDPEDVKTTFAKAIQTFSRVDIVVNNAGYVRFPSTFRKQRVDFGLVLC